MGRDYHVNREVLIPRPETEGLIEEISFDVVRPAERAIRILEVGTGSGCLVLELSRVFAVTIIVLAVEVVGLIGLAQYFRPVESTPVYGDVLDPEFGWIRELRAAEEEILSSYKLLDSEKQIYRIPIRRAMELLAESGRE